MKEKETKINTTIRGKLPVCDMFDNADGLRAEPVQSKRAHHGCGEQTVINLDCTTKVWTTCLQNLRFARVSKRPSVHERQQHYPTFAMTRRVWLASC